MKLIILIKIALLCLLCYSFQASAQPPVAFTFDDPATTPTPLYSWQQCNRHLLQTLERYNIKATLFVCGHRIDDEAGRELVKSWDQQQHQIASHSYAHRYFHSEQYSIKAFIADFLKNDSIIASYQNYTKLFRFPYLKEGDTKEKRDAARKLLQKNGYQIGYVSIDASDWYVNQLLMDTLLKNPEANLDRYRQLYLDHILDRAQFYDSLAWKVTGRQVKHVLLLHHNLCNALFLGDLVQALQRQHWKIISSAEAWSDPVYRQFPNIIPAGESIIWALAKQSGKFEGILRYPAEDSQYEEKKFLYFIRNGHY